MHNDIKTWLFDVLESINEIDSYYENNPKVYADYVSGNKMKSNRAKPRNYG